MTATGGGIGRLGKEVGAVGLGCWAIGGHFLFDGKPDGWGLVDDAESVRAIHRAIDLGVTLFDTADVYGTGHSERVLGQALKGRRDGVLIATKFGYAYDESRREITGTDLSPGYVRRACLASLARLGTDYLDLYQLHVGVVEPGVADDLLAALEDLVDEGLIRSYGWSTDEPDAIRRLAGRRGAAAAQFRLNVLSGSTEALAACEESDLTGLARTPLAMGLLTGKYDAGSRLPADDVRGSGHSWVEYFHDGRPDAGYLERLAAVREILTSDGRTLAQGALGWIMARSPRVVPIPGFKSVAQAEENAGAIARGPLTAAQMAEIDALLDPQPA
ncbi:aldo/keto reductase [Micromonospora sp. HM5-17]|jgi:aryl-alcohol dehydrogenase-like predicted oxidoreductase|uniref:aldo/keto reductase n=1 Tax=Micromonospora sp. HM5-17 TaxID=2487710 RepID=UPI000F479C4A|nr:aldo/keto reductase [Micromonospora sp. HM5-17]ROT32956.1 aldo/keto reductase [Micromonospora sp. HM5-17]